MITISHVCGLVLNGQLAVMFKSLFFKCEGPYSSMQRFSNAPAIALATSSKKTDPNLAVTTERNSKLT